MQTQKTSPRSGKTGKQKAITAKSTQAPKEKFQTQPPIEFGPDTIMIPVEHVDTNHELFGFASTIVVHEGKVVINPGTFIPDKVDTVIVSAELRKNFAEIVYIGKVPGTKIAIAILGTVMMGELETYQHGFFESNIVTERLILGRREDGTLFVIENAAEVA